jgi:hypothetical protein
LSIAYFFSRSAAMIAWSMSAFACPAIAALAGV